MRTKQESDLNVDVWVLHARKGAPRADERKRNTWQTLRKVRTCISCWWLQQCKPGTCTALLCLFVCHSHQSIQHQGVVQPGVPLLQLLQEAGSACCFRHLPCGQLAQPLDEAWNIQKCRWKKKKKKRREIILLQIKMAKTYQHIYFRDTQVYG